MKRRSILAVAGSCCLLFSGCYRRVSENGRLELSFEIWVPLVAALACILGVPLGVVVFRNSKKLAGVILALGGPMLLVGFVPSLFMDRVVVTGEGFTSTHGVWWDQTRHDVKYADLQGVNVVVEEKIGRRGKKNYSYFFDCTSKSGKMERVPLGDLMKKAIPDIITQFGDHGVAVQLPANLPE